MLMQHEIEAERKGARQRSTLYEMFTGVTEYHPIRDDEAVVGGDVQVKLRGQVLRLNPRRRIATVALPSVGRGRSFRADYAMPGKRWLAPSSRPRPARSAQRRRGGRGEASRVRR